MTSLIYSSESHSGSSSVCSQFSVLFSCVVIIISSSCCAISRYPWPPLATPPYRSSLLAGPHCYTPYLHRVSWPCEEVHRSTSLMSLSLLLQQCPACMVRLTWIVFMMGGSWPYSYCFVGEYLQDLFNIACSILVQLLSSFFSSHLVSVHVVHPYSSIETTTAWKKLHFILSVMSDFHMTNSLLIAVHAFVCHMSTSVSVDETLLPR